jgi:hypothetical protein
MKYEMLNEDFRYKPLDFFRERKNLKGSAKPLLQPSYFTLQPSDDSR